MKDDPWDLEHLDVSDYSKEELESYIRRLECRSDALRWLANGHEETIEHLEYENAEVNEKLESKRKEIKSLCEELESLRIVSIENQRLTIKNKHLEEDRPQSELDAAHLAAENAMLNANFARYISATQDTEKQNERLASMVRELQDENAALRQDKEILDWMNNNIQAVMFKYKPDGFTWDFREIIGDAMSKEAKL